MSTITRARQLEAATADLPLVGYLFSHDWRGARVRQSDLLAALMSAGFGTYAPPPISHQVSLGRAIRSWVEAQATDHGGVRLARPASEPGADEPRRSGSARPLVRVARTVQSDWILFGVVEEAVRLAGLSLEYSTALRVLVHKRTGELLVSTEAAGLITDQDQGPPLARQIAAQLRPHWEIFKTLYLAGDLGEMTRAILRGPLAAVNVHEGSGWWFVPRERTDDLGRLRATLAAMPITNGVEPASLMLGQLDTAATRRQLARAAHDDFLALLGAARQSLAELITRPEGTVRPETIAARLAEYRQLKERALLYSELLDMQHTTVARQLDDLSSQARAIVTRVMAATVTSPS